MHYMLLRTTCTFHLTVKMWLYYAMGKRLDGFRCIILKPSSLFPILEHCLLYTSYDGRAKAIISALRERSAQYDLALMKKLLNRAKPYTVSLFEYQLKELEKNGGIALEEDRQIITLNPNFYDENTGVVTCAENIF